MSPQTKSLIRHVITALGLVFAALGLGKYTGLLDSILANMDGVIEAVTTVVGFVMMVLGYFKNADRFKE